jgi:hypothetical protein
LVLVTPLIAPRFAVTGQKGDAGVRTSRTLRAAWREVMAFGCGLLGNVVVAASSTWMRSASPPPLVCAIGLKASSFEMPSSS